MKPQKRIFTLFTLVICLVLCESAVGDIWNPPVNEINPDDNRILVTNQSGYDVILSVDDSKPVEIKQGTQKEIATIKNNPSVGIFFHKIGDEEVSHGKQFSFDTKGYPGRAGFVRPLGFRIADIQSKKNPSTYYVVTPELVSFPYSAPGRPYPKIFQIILGPNTINKQ